MRITEMISTLICIVSGIAAFILWKIWPNNFSASPATRIDILKTVVSVIFLCSGLLTFILQIVGLFHHE